LVAAEKFCGREGLHRGYIDEVTKWLRKNSSVQSASNQPGSSTKSSTQTKPGAKNQVYQSERVKFPKVCMINHNRLTI
jgi:hypothetical protein